MIETIDARTALPRAPRGISAWNYTRSAKGIRTWRHPEPPEGVSLVTITQTPDHVLRLRAEGNLTSCRYGKAAAVASLGPDDLHSARDAFLSAVTDSVGTTLPATPAWDLHRLDPSQTVVLPAHLQSSEVIAAAERAWSLCATPRQVVSRHNRETVVYRHSKWRSWSVYNKTAEAKSRGLTAPERALRLEARVLPRKGSGAWKELAPTLELTPQTLELVMTENDDLLETIAQQIAASTALATVRALMRGGATVNTAMRLASFVAIADTAGRDVLEQIGLPDSTSRRWRAEVRRYLDNSGGEEHLELDATEMTPVLAAQFVQGLAQARQQQADQ